jgi:hypothetical protein
MNVWLNCPPGAIGPELNDPSLAVDVCVVESRLVHVTAPPALTMIGFGAYAVVVIVEAPLTIDAPTAGLAGDDEGMEGVDDWPQPSDPPSRAAIRTVRNFIRASPHRRHRKPVASRTHQSARACFLNRTQPRRQRMRYEI